MEHSDEQSKTIEEALDTLERVREELMMIQRSLEKRFPEGDPRRGVNWVG